MRAAHGHIMGLGVDGGALTSLRDADLELHGPTPNSAMSIIRTIMGRMALLHINCWEFTNEAARWICRKLKRECQWGHIVDARGFRRSVSGRRQGRIGESSRKDCRRNTGSTYP